MFLQIKDSRDLVKIVDIQELLDPTKRIAGRLGAASL